MRDAMVPEIDAHYGVYVLGRDGEWHFNMELFAAYLKRNGIEWPRTERGTLSTQAQDVRGHEQGPSAAGEPAAAPARARQDAQDQAGGRCRRPQSHSAVAVPVEDVAHAAEGIAVDILARGLAALPDQARTRSGGRLCRLEFDGVHDRGQSVRRSGHARVLPHRRSLPVLRQTCRGRAARRHQADARAAAGSLQGRLARDPVRHPGGEPGRRCSASRHSRRTR